MEEELDPLVWGRSPQKSGDLFYENPRMTKLLVLFENPCFFLFGRVTFNTLSPRKFRAQTGPLVAKDLTDVTRTRSSGGRMC